MYESFFIFSLIDKFVEDDVSPKSEAKRVEIMKEAKNVWHIEDFKRNKIPLKLCMLTLEALKPLKILFVSEKKTFDDKKYVSNDEVCLKAMKSILIKNRVKNFDKSFWLIFGLHANGSFLYPAFKSFTIKIIFEDAL